MSSADLATPPESPDEAPQHWLRRLWRGLRRGPAPPMDATRWQRVTELVEAALQRPDRRQRACFLRRACAGDPALRREVEALLRYEDADAAILEGPLMGRQPKAAPTTGGDDEAPAGDDLEAPGRVIGPYVVEGPLGRGGMGLVVRARHGSIGQQVALKLVRRERVSDTLLRRFEDERRILARLEHPGIARILGGGTAADLPYFAMEVVAGEPIDAYCDARRLGVEERLRLLLPVCEALDYAHRHLVVHRDLKPSNLLVTAEGVPKLLDFGIAKDLDPQTEGGLATVPGQGPLTHAYASPEQMRGLQVTTGSDVYALGVLLYCLLTGRPPYELDGDRFENARTVCEAVPEPPSAVVTRTRETWRHGAPLTLAPATLAACRGSEPRRLARRLRGDLDSMVLRCLAKVPDGRYASVAALADDLRRHLAGRPVAARRASWLERGAKLVARNRRRLALGAGLVLLLGVVMIVPLRRAARATAAKERAAAQRQQAEQQAAALEGFMQTLLRATDPDSRGGEPLTVRQLLDRGAASARATLGAEPATLASQLEAIGLAYQALGHHQQALPVLADSLRLRRQLYGDHALVARGLSNLASLRLLVGQPQWAEKLFRLSLDMRLRLGQAEEELAKTRSNLATLLMLRGDYDGAEALYLESLAVRERVWGKDDPDVATSLRSLGNLDYLRGRFGPAEEKLRRALAIREAHYGRQSRLVAAVLGSLGRVVAEQGRWEEAEALLTETVAMRAALMGDDHLHTALARRDLAVVLAARGEEASAAVLWQRAEAVMRRALAANAWELAELESRLGARLAAAGKGAAAALCLEQSYRALRDQRGVDALYTRQALARWRAADGGVVIPARQTRISR